MAPKSDEEDQSSAEIVDSIDDLITEFFLRLNMESETQTSTEESDEDQSSAEIVASIDDLLFEIFLRLPMKSLIRFKSVSKRWQSLISDPGFCIRRNPDPNPAVGLLIHDSRWSSSPRNHFLPFSSTEYSKNPPFAKSNFANNMISGVLQSCNGLLLCHSFRAVYYVYNPTTNQFSKLPEIAGGGEMSMSLAFDPTKSPHYRVVCANRLINNQYQFEVYSSESRIWKKRGEPVVERAKLGSGVYWNGSIHWVGKGFALRFEVDDDDGTIQAMPMPPMPDPENWGWGTRYYFGESCDHLHYIVTIGVQIEFNVYEMRRDYSEWFVKYKVDLSPVVHLGEDYVYDIFTLVRGEKEEDVFLVLQIPGKVIRYDVSGTFETIYELAGDDNGISLGFKLGNNRFQYFESLCCV